MTLRARIALALLAISVILVGPAIYAISALQELNRIATSLRTGNAEHRLQFGDLQADLQQLENQQRQYYVQVLPTPAERDHMAIEAARAQVDSQSTNIEQILRYLASVGYAEQTAPAEEAWARVRLAIERERELMEAGDEGVDTHRFSELEPAFERMRGTLAPIGAAIDISGSRQVETAQRVARGAARTVYIALGIALALAVVVAGLLTRSMLRPINELRRGMAVVAGGDLEPEVHIARDRPDELGDLARSFERMTEQLAELDRLKAEFISIASHELKTPLSVIRGYVSLLLEEIYGELSEEQRKPLASVIEQTDRLARLVQQLLDISRFEAGGGRLDLRDVELRDFLASLASSFDALAMQNDTQLVLDVDGSLPTTIVADPERLNEVVGNLLSNAFKFTPRGGRIEVRASGLNGGGACIEVADTGIGVPADKLPRIFEKFFQVDNEAQPRSVGSGLGLAIAREIVEAHGGTIAAESAVGRGTTFRVELPPRPPEPEA